VADERFSEMNNHTLPRIDTQPKLHSHLLQYSRLKPGEIWDDPLGKHRVGCLDATNMNDVTRLLNDEKATIAIQDPPYNLIAFDQQKVDNFIDWCRLWVENSANVMSNNSSFYIWLGADQNRGFQPLPDFMLMMRNTDFNSRSFITMRNQRGYGTQKNWMAIRQELLYYTRGNPPFKVVYTDIPKILKGYYKKVDGKVTNNLERSRSDMIRAGNVWVDIQQVFYRMEENVNGCYAQKPLKSCSRIINSSSQKDDLVIDFFSHSGSTIISAEINERRCYTMDIDPVFCEITIRRLERFRETGLVGWQNGNAFEKEYIVTEEVTN
jgi:site-specific DNA-methyltransferase (adenine-specific)